ncbi:DUF6492 family protein [Butyrivibrio sp.]|uniref:DUF6492 family protein n=1 Tax=Butyrivibrio sp. TaxID=28121 RepID=UPI0025BB13CF|nr:DUF6492 family protein [Butyrivibrio sp.]MBQ9301602.1 hypothetical protein [Butyrivibrio sp.]
MQKDNHFDVLIVVTAPDCQRLLGMYRRLIDNYSYGKICFIGNEAVRDVAYSNEKIRDYITWINENDVIAFNDVHQVISKRLADALGGKELPRGITGWYYQQFLKMQYAFMCKDEYYMVWDGDTVPCRPINMFSIETGQPYIDLKHEYHPEYFETLGKILPGFKKVIERSFISEHMLIRCDIMKSLIADIEKNESIEGEKFWEKIINAIEPDKIFDSSFSEFETYGTYVALRYPSVYKLRDWHSFRMGAMFFDLNTICDRDFAWLSKDFDAISFEKGQEVREDNKNFFDNPEYQEKLSAKKMLQLAQMEFNDGYKEIWQDDILAKQSGNVNAGDFALTNDRDRRVVIVISDNSDKKDLDECTASIESVLNTDSYTIVYAGKDDSLTYGARINNAVKDIHGGDYDNCDILLLDSSTRLAFDTLYFLKSALYSQNDIGAVGCVSNLAVNKQVIDAQFDTEKEYMDFGMRNNIPMERPCIERVSLSSYAMLIKRSVWNEVHGMEEGYSLKAVGDEAFALKLLENGYRSMLVRNSFIYNTSLQSEEGDTKGQIDKLSEEMGFDVEAAKHVNLSLIQEINKDPSDRLMILCYGCGIGADIKALKYLYYQSEIVGIEPDSKMAEIAKKTENILPGIEEVIDFYGEGSFDVILVEKNPEDEVLMAMLSSLLNEDGVMIGEKWGE